jgi:hypothetical protein
VTYLILRQVDGSSTRALTIGKQLEPHYLLATLRQPLQLVAHIFSDDHSPEDLTFCVVAG